MSGSIQDLLSVKELKEWLLGRVADDDDIVIDDLQEEFNQQFDDEDEKNGIKVGITVIGLGLVLKDYLRLNS